MSQYEVPIQIPPVDIVRQFYDMQEMSSDAVVLDAGCGSGRNSLFLAEAGYRMITMSNSVSELRAIDQKARDKQLAGSIACVAGDVRHLPFDPVFDAVLINEVLHFMTKNQSSEALKTAQGLTVPGGFNIISGYVVKPGTANLKNTANCLHPAELSTIYAQSGWRIHTYSEQYHPNQYVGQGRVKELISSRAKIIAQKLL
ncbi:MAG: class I SAM-dependent methyltransferase [Candidatus Saccharimonadales bacterium]